jgi:glyoxylase-like metal-dependent hydrolase (beta-lactamase superfamily II)
MTTQIFARRESRDPGVAYVFDAEPEIGTGLEVAPGVFWLRMPLPFALDHINLWLLRDGGGWTIVDTGIARDEVKAAWRLLFKEFMCGEPVKRILSTHFHPDHFGLAGWLVDTLDAPLWMTRSEWLMGSLLYGDVDARVSDTQAALFRNHGLDEPRLQALAGRGNAYRRLMAPPPPRYRRIRDGERLSIDGSEWTVIVGRGHAPEHACLFCADKGVLISGDQVLPRISPNVSLSAIEPEANPLKEFLDSIEELSGLPADTLVLPSHDFPFYGLKARIATLHQHHDERLESLERYCTVPRTAAETLEIMFRRSLDSHQIMFAMGESLSHLVYLEAGGRLKRGVDENGVYRFVKRA